MKRNFSTVRALIGDLAKRNRTRMGLQLVTRQIQVLTTFYLPGVDFSDGLWHSALW
jgi:hypothetical protein